MNTPTALTPISFLGLGEMGRALAATVIDAGDPVTVWNRSPGRSARLAGRATVAGTAADAVAASELVVVCLFDTASVRETLDPLAGVLRGRTVVNLTTTSPAQARELAGWAAPHGVTYLDGGIMAVPDMIGGPGSTIFFSGDATAFGAHEAVFARWGEAAFVGADPGTASLYDMAMLSGMYVMFAGFLHGAAMVHGAGISAAEFATRQTTFLAAMTDSFADFARIVDDRDYDGAGQQSLEFSDLSTLVEASAEAGVDTGVLGAVQRLIAGQIAAGHGQLGFARIFEGLRSAA